jgi:hypothetical protein
MWPGAHQSESSGSGSKDGSPKDFADEVLLTIEEYREKRRADKGARATFLLNQFDEGKLMVLNAMGLKYVVDVDMLEAHDQACEDRKKEDENDVPPFDRARMKTMTYSAAAFLHMDPAATDTTPKGLEAVVTKMRATATGKVALFKWDEMVITVIKKALLLMDPAKINESFRFIELEAVTKTSLMQKMIQFVRAVMEADKRADLSTMSTEGVNKILEGLNKKIAARASNLAARIVEQTENKIPGTNIEAWTEIVLRETKDALKHGSLDDIDGDAALREEIAALKAENTRLTAALARGSAPAKQQVWCHTCYKMGTHETKDHDDNRANNGNGGKGGKGNDGKGGKGNDGKGGKGATDQTYYDKNGVVIWRSKADQAAHMAQKQQQRRP